MTDNIKSSNQRLKILYLHKILLEQTDEEHSITMSEIIAQLREYGITAGRKALYEDIEALKRFGLDISSGKGMNAGYRVVSRDFQLPELRLLAAAVSSSETLTKDKSKELLKKLERLTSVYEANEMHRQMCEAEANNPTTYSELPRI